MAYVYVISGYVNAKEDPIMGPRPEHRVILSVHSTYTGLLKALETYNRKILEYKDERTKDWTQFYGYDYVDYVMIKLEE